MSVDSAIRRFRRRQAAQFSATCNIHRPIGERTYNPDTGQSVQPVELRYAALECKVSQTDRGGSEEDAGETQVRVIDSDIKFPIDTDVAMDDIVTILTSTYNPLSVGKQYRIREVDEREWQISRRCSIEETVVPMLWEDS